MTLTRHPLARGGRSRRHLSSRSTLTALGATAALVALGACSDAALPTRPASSGGPSLLIEDAVHNYGNIHFFWLPPTVPTMPAFNGQPNDNFYPYVEICQLDAQGQACDPSVPLIARYTRTSGPDNTKLYVSTAQHWYNVNVYTTPRGMTADKQYRATAFLLKSPIGTIDIDVVPTLGDVAGVDRTQFVGVAQGQPLYLYFRLEYGAIYPVVNAGGTIQALNNSVTFTYPAYTFPAEEGMTIQPAAAGQLPTDQAQIARLAPGSAYELGPDPLPLAQSPALTIAYDALQLPAGTNESELRLHRFDADGTWKEIPGSSVDLSAHTVTGTISKLGIYAALVRKQDVTANDIDAGGWHACSLDATGKAYCWGANGNGELGNGFPGAATGTPQAVAGGLTFASVYTGYYHSCALTTAGQAYCWGFGGYGQLGNGAAPNTQSSPVPVSGGLTFKSLALGYYHTCGVTLAGKMYCWGYGGYGNLGNGFTGGSQVTPLLVSGNLTWASVTAGFVHTCGVTTSGAGYCWGYGGYGALGNGNFNQSTVPQAVAGGLTFASMSAGEVHSCGLTTAGAAYCWGYNYYGQIGDGHMYYDGTSGGNPYTPAPQPVSGGSVFQSLGAGIYHTCGVTTAGQAKCWGYGGSGALGIGPNVYAQSTPVTVAGGDTWAKVAAGGFFTCGVTTGGTTKCWGENANGTLGIGTVGANVFTPVVSNAP